MLNAVLADITTQVDHLTQDQLRRLPLSTQPRNRAGENLSAAPSACFNPLLRDDPLQMLAQAASRPQEARLPLSHHNSVDINLPTPPGPLTQPHLNTGSGSSMDMGSIDSGLEASSYTPLATLVISANTPTLRCSSVIPGPGDTCHQDYHHFKLQNH